MLSEIKETFIFYFKFKFCSCSSVYGKVEKSKSMRLKKCG
jgi:hypothetical protein